MPALTAGLNFEYSRIMEMTSAVEALGALAHGHRLAIFRLLVRAGAEGMPAGKISEALGIPAATLSFHLAHLTRAGMASSRQDGRYVIYAADFDGMGHLLAFLTEDCCGGKACVPMPIQFVVNRPRRRASA